MAKDYSMQFNLKAKDNFSPTMKRAAANATASANTIAGADARMVASSQRLSATLARQGIATKGAGVANTGLAKSLTGLVAPYASATVAAGALVLGLKNLITSTADAGDQIFDLSKRFGASTEFFSEMKFVADQNGSSLDALGIAIRSVSRRASIGTKEFSKWGVEVRDSTGQLKNAEGLFFSAVDRINELGTDAEKTAASMDIFGDAGAGMLQIIKLGSAGIREARKEASGFGLTMSGEAAAAANDFNNQVSKLDSSVEGLTRQIGVDLLPEVVHWVRVLADASKWTRENWAAVKNYITTLSPLAAMIRANAAAMKTLVDTFGGTDPVFERFTTAQKEYNDEAERTTEVLTTNVVIAGQLAELEKRESARRAKQRAAAAAARKKEADDAKKQLEKQSEADLALAVKQAELNKKRKDEDQAAHVAWLNEKLDANDAAMIRQGEQDREAAAARVATASLVEDAQRASAQAAANAISNGMMQAVSDTDNAGKHMTKSVINAAQAAIMAYAASASAAAAFSQAGIPIIGPILATTAAGVMFGLVNAFMDELPSFQTGGVVSAATPGGPAVITAHDNERIFNADQNERMVRALEGGSGGGSHLHVNSMLAPTRMEVTQQWRRLKFHERRLAKLGMA